MKRNRNGSVLLATMLAVLSGAPATAADVAGLFSRGRTHLVVSGGNGYAFDQSYFVLGIGARYNLLDGFGVGLHGERWSGADPGITKITPSVEYVFYQVPRLSPYIGAFYRSVSVDNLPDLDSSGGRAGVYLAASRNAYFGAGMVRETYHDCTETVYRDCSDTYSEFSFTFVF